MTTQLELLITRVPKDTRIVISEIEDQTGISSRKLLRLRKGKGAVMSLTDATLLANYFKQYFPNTTAESLNTGFEDLAKKLKATK